MDNSWYPRALKGKSRSLINKRSLLYFVVTLVLLYLVFSIIHSLEFKMRSRSLVSKINNLQSSSTCKTGLKQISPLSPNFVDSSKYSITARENGLNYLVNCEFIAGRSELALKYAKNLSGLYKSSGNNSKEQQLEQLEQYIKNYGQQL